MTAVTFSICRFQRPETEALWQPGALWQLWPWEGFFFVEAGSVRDGRKAEVWDKKLESDKKWIGAGASSIHFCYC